MHLHFLLVLLIFSSCGKFDSNNKTSKELDSKTTEIVKENSIKDEIKKPLQFDIKNTNWVEIDKVDSKFKILNSEWKRKVEISDNKILIELLEPSSYIISDLVKTDDGFIFNIKDAEWTYRFKWENIEKKIGRWDYIHNTKIDSSFSYYSVLKEYQDQLK